MMRLTLKQTFALSFLLVGLVMLVGHTACAARVGAAGCGLGSIVMGRDSQVLAASSNMIGGQTFGILFGTSNCKEVGPDAAMVEFVEANKTALATDAARGQGETVKALSSILGCSNTSALGNALKENYEEIFATKKDDPVAITHEIRETVESSRFLARSCSR